MNSQSNNPDVQSSCPLDAAISNPIMHLPIHSPAYSLSFSSLLRQEHCWKPGLATNMICKSWVCNNHDVPILPPSLICMLRLAI